MDRIRIRGGRQLKGEIRISGSKNASLPLMVTALLTDKKLVLHNVPRLADIATMIQLLKQHGVEIEAAPGENGHARGTTLTLRRARSPRPTAPYDIVRKMRASVLVLGAAAGARAARRGCRCPAAAPSARGRSTCTSQGLEAMGAQIDLDGGYIAGEGAQGPQGRALHLPQGLGRRDREPDDGGGAGQGHAPCSTTPRASPRSPTSPTAWSRWACRIERHRHRDAHHRGRRAAARRDAQRHPRPHRDRHLCHGGGDDGGRCRAAAAAGST